MRDNSSGFILDTAREEVGGREANIFFHKVRAEGRQGIVTSSSTEQKETCG